MTIELKPEQQRVIDLAVGSGAYRNPGEVLDQAFAIIREQLELEDWMFEQRDRVAAQIATGFAQAERGELTDGDAALAALRQRRAERLKPQDEWALSVHPAGNKRPRSHLVVHCKRQQGSGRRSGTGDRRHVPPIGHASADGKDAADITSLPVRLWTVTAFPSYAIVYRPDTTPCKSSPSCTESGTSRRFWLNAPETDDALNEAPAATTTPVGAAAHVLTDEQHQTMQDAGALDKEASPERPTPFCSPAPGHSCSLTRHPTSCREANRPSPASRSTPRRGRAKHDCLDVLTSDEAQAVLRELRSPGRISSQTHVRQTLMTPPGRV